MKCTPTCEPCLQRLLRKAASLAASGDRSLAGRALASAAEELERCFQPSRSVPTRVASRGLRRIRELTGNTDPFASVKKMELDAARRALPLVEPHFRDDLRARVLLSALGNRLDFFREVEEVEREWREQTPSLAFDQTAGLRTDLLPGRRLLFLTDNAGEVLFDLPLLEHLREIGVTVTAAVKGGPSQNDLTRADVRRWRLPLPAVVDTGSDAVGCELERVGAELRHAWERADVVLAKGMANFETLTEYPDALAEKPVYFLLCAKCPPVAQQWGVGVGESVLASAALWLQRRPA